MSTLAATGNRWFRADNIRWILLFNVIAEHMLTQTNITRKNARLLLQTGVFQSFSVFSLAPVKEDKPCPAEQQHPPHTGRWGHRPRSWENRTREESPPL